MDGAFFVSRTELLGWVNSVLDLNLSKVEQCANGAVYCQVIDACHPGTVLMKKVNWNARAEHESVPNYKVLQQAFDRCGIERHVEVDKLVRGKYQDNLEMLQWIKTYFDRTSQGGEYNAVARRFCADPPEWARAAPAGNGGSTASRSAGSRSSLQGSLAPAAGRNLGARGRVAPGDPQGGSRPSTSGGYPVAQSRRGAPSAPAVASSAEVDGLKEDNDTLREEVVDLKITVDGLETERDFYFQKLRDIEILCQALEANPDPHMTVSKFVEDVQRILYAKDEEEDDIG